MAFRSKILVVALATMALTATFCNAGVLDMDTEIDLSFTQGVLQGLEKIYRDDCLVDSTPHGYYGAFLQPCEISFYKEKQSMDGAVTDRAHQKSDVCMDESSKLVGQRIPMHWFFNLTYLYSKETWESFASSDDSSDSSDSSDDSDDDDFRTTLAQIADTLVLWPDQCVGVQPRCYKIKSDEEYDNDGEDVDPVIRDALERLYLATNQNQQGSSAFEIPMNATHVQVNCMADAVALTRVVYAAADGLESSLPAIFIGLFTTFLLSLLAFACCIYGGCYLYHRWDRRTKAMMVTGVGYSYNKSMDMGEYSSLEGAERNKGIKMMVESSSEMAPLKQVHV